MAVADYGSRAPISEENPREFRISNNDIGIKVKTNRVKRLNIRDHSLTKLAEICFKVNSISQPCGRGSAAERFLKRSPKTFLPGTMRDHIDHVEMVKKRHEHQVSLSLKKGSTSFDEFLPGGRVVIQDNSSGKWLEEGVIDQARRAFNPMKSRWKTEPPKSGTKGS